MELVKSGADIQHVYSHAAKSHHQPIILVVGTNDISKRSQHVIYRKWKADYKL